MKRILCLLALLGALVVPYDGGAAFQPPTLGDKKVAAPARPNILHIHADDHRPDGLHALGNPLLVTPNLDTLVERGMTFTRAYTMGSMIGAVCTPSRTMMLTGRSWQRIPGASGATPNTATGAASMYACLGDGEKAYHYLDFLIQHKNVSPTTMYAEGNPVIESPLSFATSIHDMLLQSWGGKIRVFQGTPKKWADVAFQHMRTQGAFLVSAKRKAGLTQFVTVESLVGSPCVVEMDIPNPKISINGAPAAAAKVRRTGQGLYEIDLKKGETATFAPVAPDKADLTIAPIPVSEAERNLFGLSEKSTRLPGHKFYYKK